MGVSKDAEGYQHRIHQPQRVTNIDSLPPSRRDIPPTRGDALLQAREAMRNTISHDVTNSIRI
ncbi:hypothetical protein NR402_02595 [Acidithiobacillus ferrooxidans]|jgi:hypothetical protein|uniref:hypothetical protein n=1 Tax=Acidithiobacillus ferrooxidans TaxID=920 RepID=UPI001C0668BB|nr:hypothetical protein [Acidithiobacillus ferrooxidans]MCR2829178.1 hypothetical protein [Acidithiobacillus ferrooxidans]